MMGKARRDSEGAPSVSCALQWVWAEWSNAFGQAWNKAILAVERKRVRESKKNHERKMLG